MPALPARLAAELIHALAGLAIGGPLTRSGLPPP